MNWGPFVGLCVLLLFLFLITGYPVTPSLKGRIGNYYTLHNSTYFAWLAVHYWLGAFFLSFTLVGLFRTLIWSNDGKQVANVMSWAMFLSGGFMLFGVYKVMPAAGAYQAANSGTV